MEALGPSGMALINTACVRARVCARACSFDKFVAIVG